MECYLYELPTTGNISFTDLYLDESCKYVNKLAAVTASRASLRTILKQSKRTDGEKDYLKLVKILDDYLPHLYAVISILDAREVTSKAELVFSWRTTLSSNLFHSSPRVAVTGLAAELTFSLLTYAFALSNLARSTVLSLGVYEHDRHLTDAERRIKDEKLSFAVNLLCRAGGIFIHIVESVLPKMRSGNPKVFSGVPDFNKDVVTSLSLLALADAQNLAIRKLMSKSSYDSLISPGPPFPKSHPSPALVAKLYLHVASCYSSAHSLVKSHGEGDISPNLRRYLLNQSALTQASAYKWLGVDAGESGTRGGDAVAFLKWAKAELEDVKEKERKFFFSKQNDDERPSRVATELDTVKAFLRTYQKLNDSVHFHPVPSTSTLQSLVPTGKSALVAKPFSPPRPAFGPNSLVAQQPELSNLPDTSENSPKSSSYVGAGSYF